jgi:hypothetical protein
MGSNDQPTAQPTEADLATALEIVTSDELFESGDRPERYVAEALAAARAEGYAEALAAARVEDYRAGVRDAERGIYVPGSEALAAARAEGYRHGFLAGTAGMLDGLERIPMTADVWSQLEQLAARLNVERTA